MAEVPKVFFKSLEGKPAEAPSFKLGNKIEESLMLACENSEFLTPKIAKNKRRDKMCRFIVLFFAIKMVVRIETHFNKCSNKRI